ncbi:MAG: hypothetical protein QW555_07935 [Nitrososphaerota archaeon]
MEQIKVTITGVPPGLLFHRLSPEMEEKMSRARNNATREEIERNNCHLYIYYNSEGRPSIPSIWLINSLKQAAAEVKIPGRGKKTYKNLVGAGFILIQPDMIPLESDGWTIYAAPVVVQRARIIRHRPLFPQWRAMFTIIFDEQHFTQKLIEELLQYAGAFVGIGDYRPQRGGPFGRFTTQFNI